jgi:hypothetical protein
VAEEYPRWRVGLVFPSLARSSNSGVGGWPVEQTHRDSEPRMASTGLSAQPAVPGQKQLLEQTPARPPLEANDGIGPILAPNPCLVTGSPRSRVSKRSARHNLLAFNHL